jgi:hypothetical protein
MQVCSAAGSIRQAVLLSPFLDYKQFSIYELDSLYGVFNCGW